MSSSAAPVRETLSGTFHAGSNAVRRMGVARGTLTIVPIILLAVGSSSNVTAQSFSNVPAPKLGPVSLGISLEEAQSALPAAEWRVEARFPSGKPSRFAAEKALEWAGNNANVTLASTYHKRQNLLNTLAKETNAQSCLERTKNWSVKLAETNGALDSDRPTVRFDENIVFGQGGVARLSATQDLRYWPTQKWSGLAPADRYFSAKPEFARAGYYETAALWTARYSPKGCAIEPAMTQTVAQPADIQELPNALQRIVLKPSIGRRHFLASSLKNWIPPLYDGDVRNTDRSPRDILPEAVTAQVRCLINRRNGIARQCELAAGEPSYPSGVEDALTSLGASYQFDTSGLGLDIDDPAPLQVTLPVTVSPSDIVSTQFQLPDAPLQVPFKLPDNFFERAIPQEAVATELGAKILVLCQIQSDQSVVCKIASFAETNQKKLAVLQRIYTPSVIKSVHRVKVCPDGCSVAPPVGTVFKIDLEFKFD
jgi:hypothetical protein